MRPARIPVALLLMATCSLSAGGCHLPGPPTPPFTPTGVLCDPELPLPTTDDACPNRFIFVGGDEFACARCPGYGSCIDVRDLVWCVGPAGCAECGVVTPNGVRPRAPGPRAGARARSP